MNQVAAVVVVVAVIAEVETMIDVIAEVVVVREEEAETVTMIDVVAIDVTAVGTGKSVVSHFRGSFFAFF